LVDDQESCLQLLRALVESAGYRCVTARSGADALVVCAEHRPQAVITDLSMPDLDGSVLAGWLRARYPTVPLVLLTGQDLDGPAFERLRPAFSSILQKPVDPERLLDLLASLLTAHGHFHG
jgi:CheY-like chemotaxis protein